MSVYVCVHKNMHRCVICIMYTSIIYVLYMYISYCSPLSMLHVKSNLLLANGMSNASAT